MRSVAAQDFVAASLGEAQTAQRTKPPGGADVNADTKHSTIPTNAQKK